jgi:hypothetical protein
MNFPPFFQRQVKAKRLPGGNRKEDGLSFLGNPNLSFFNDMNDDPSPFA